MNKKAKGIGVPSLILIIGAFLLLGNKAIALLSNPIAILVILVIVAIFIIGDK